MRAFKLILVASILMGWSISEARDTRHRLSIKEAMETSAAKAAVDPKIKFVFGTENAPKNVKQNFGEFMSNKKTNAFNKTDKEACMWVFLSAIKSFQDRARNVGADAVINLRSYYKKNLVDSTTEFECGAGALMAGVTFKGEVVKLK